MLLWGGSGGGKEERERVKERKGGMEGNTFLRILSTMYSTYIVHAMNAQLCPCTMYSAVIMMCECVTRQ